MTSVKFELGTKEWDAMQEREVVAGFARAGWADEVRFSLVERYAGGPPLPKGLIYGFHVDVVGSTATFRRGVRPDETGDVTVDVSMQALRQLVHMSSNDPRYLDLNEHLINSGDIVRQGEFEPLKAVSRDVHHHVYEQTI